MLLQISGPLFIGGVPAPDYGAQIWNGEIDEFALFDRILSGSEIDQLSEHKPPASLETQRAQRKNNLFPLPLILQK